MILLLQVATFSLWSVGAGARVGALGFQHVGGFWIAGGIVGMIFAAFGGDPTKESSNSAAFWGMALNGGFLVILGFLYVASFVHD